MQGSRQLPSLNILVGPDINQVRSSIAQVAKRKERRYIPSNFLQPAFFVSMSPRLKKKRCCEGEFCGQAFKPVGLPLRQLNHIILYRDELESLKLCDLEGLTQEQAGERMGISRGTVQRLLTGSRRKVAEALVSGAALVFSEDT